MRLARRAGLDSQVSGKLALPGAAGFDGAAKVASIVGGMIAGADSIDDVDVLREGATGLLSPARLTSTAQTIE